MGALASLLTVFNNVLLSHFVIFILFLLFMYMIQECSSNVKLSNAAGQRQSNAEQQ